MSYFALKLPMDEDVRAWITRIKVKLQGFDYAKIPFQTADLKILTKGVVVFDITPLFPRFLGWLVLVPSFVVALFGQMIGWELGWVFTIGGTIFFLWEMFWTPYFYWLVVWIQVRRLTGKWHKVSLADKDVLRWAIYGKV